jgi:hypothetical protein
MTKLLDPLAVQTVVASHDPRVTTFSRPFTRVLGLLKFEVGGRMTVVKMAHGGLFVFSPIKLDDVTRETIQRMGEVEYIVLPDLEHHLYAADYLTLNPSATIIGVPGLDKKRKDLSFEHLMGGPAEQRKPFGLEHEFDYLYLDKTVNRESLFFHRPSNTLLTADLLWNLPAVEQYKQAGPGGKPRTSFNFMTKINSSFMNPESIGHTAFMWYVMAKGAQGRTQIGDAMKKVIEEWKPTSIVMCHGETVVGSASDVRNVLKRGFRWWKL